MALLTSRIHEVIVTTISENGKVHSAPMGISIVIGPPPPVSRLKVNILQMRYHILSWKLFVWKMMTHEPVFTAL